MAQRSARIKFTLKRVKGFLSALRRSKRGMFGVAIIVIAVFVALAAPLLTPYNPLFTYNLAGTLVPPGWARYLPGGGGLTLNLFAVDEASLLQSANALSKFNVTVTPSNVTQDVSVQQSEFGTSESNGSLMITFQTAGLPINSSLTVQITRDFYYPYSGIPGAMSPQGSILLSRMEGVAVSPTLIFVQKWPTFSPQHVASYNTTQFEFGQYWENPNVPGPVAYSNDNYTSPTASAAGLSWIIPKVIPQSTPLYESSGDSITLKQLFPKAGTYSYGISLTVTKLAANAGAVVYVNNLNLNLLGSSWGFLGTDPQGRDVFTQLVYGTQVSLYVGLTAAFFATFIGLFVGLVAAYMGGIVDEVLMRFTDALLVLPTLPLMIVLILALSGGQYNINILIIVFGALGWQGFARVVRSQVLSLKERPYVEAAKAVGAGTPYILWRHILPNVVVLIYVTLALTVPAAIVTEAAFSFLGFIDLAHMSWGRMLTTLVNTPSIWWIVVPPGLAIMILSLSFILIGYAIDDILNPKLRTRR
jgi:peptide/nickel transport system permease protein